MKLYLAGNPGRRSKLKLSLALALSILLVLPLTSAPSVAQNPYDWFVTAHVTTILNVQSLPSNFDFQTDNTPGTCNGFIFYFPGGADEATQIANGKAVFATLMAAQLSGHSVAIYGKNPTGGSSYCSVYALHITNQ